MIGAISETAFLGGWSTQHGDGHIRHASNGIHAAG